MDKRTKILLIVLVALSLLAGGYFAYMKMSAEEITTAVAPPVATKKPAKPAKSKPAQPEAGAPEAAPAETAPQTAPAESKPGEKAAALKPQAGAGGGVAKPGEAGKGKTAAAPEKAAPKAEGKEAAKAGAKPAEAGKAAQCVTVLKAVVKGKKVEFKTPEELVEKSGMDEKAMRAYATKNLDAAKKKQAELTKAKAPAADMECTKKSVEVAGSLVKLVDTKFAKKAEKEAYTYSSLDKRDPFMSPMEIPRVYPPVPANAPPLERIPTEQLKVKGIMWNEKGFRALVFTNDGRGYTVKVGDTIGNKGGKIVRITEQNIYVEERIPDIFGDIEIRSIVIKLHKEAK